MRANNNKSEASKADSYLTKHNIPMWLIIFSLICSFIAICGLFISKDVIIHKESIVLTFIGILATFVVVSNYVQIKEIKDSHEEFRKEKKVFESEIREHLDYIFYIDSFIINGKAEHYVSNSDSSRRKRFICYTLALECAAKANVEKLSTKIDWLIKELSRILDDDKEIASINQAETNPLKKQFQMNFSYLEKEITNKKFDLLIENDSNRFITQEQKDKVKNIKETFNELPLFK